MDYSIILAAGFIIFAGQVVKGFTGFGNSLVSIPFLVLILDLEFILPFFSLLGVLTGVLMFYRERNSVRWDVMRYLVTGMVLGTVFGVIAVEVLTSVYLKRLFGITVFLMALHLLYENLSEKKQGISRRGLIGFISGSISGVTGAMFGIDGPPLVYYTARTCVRKNEFRATLFGLFLLLNITRVGGYTMSGLLTIDSIYFTLFMLPAMTLGLIAGDKMHFRVNERLFKHIVILIIAITGLISLLS